MTITYLKDIEASVTESQEDRMAQMTPTISTANQQIKTAAACSEKVVSLEDRVREKTETLKDLACDSKTIESVKSIINLKGMEDSRGSELTDVLAFAMGKMLCPIFMDYSDKNQSSDNLVR